MAKAAAEPARTNRFGEQTGRRRTCRGHVRCLGQVEINVGMEINVEVGGGYADIPAGPRAQWRGYAAGGSSRRYKI